MHIKFVLTLFVLILQNINSQNDLRWPIDPPHKITGNYGEIRPNHFHAGIDFSTSNRTGLNVYSVADGYVSRVKVSPYGYGRCIYITHYNGMVSVYAHLNSFSLKVSQKIAKEQFLLKSYEVELLPAPYSILVKRGEIIGLSGNSGGSSGPHLHFELRDEKSETPLNVLRIMKVKDVMPPVIQAIALYDLSDTTSPKIISTRRLTKLSDSIYTINDVITISGIPVGIAYSGFDRLSATANANNIYEARMYLDGRMIYSHKLNNIDFADNRYANEFSEKFERVIYQKCFTPEIFPKAMYNDTRTRGRIMLKDTLVHKIKLELLDEAGNRSSVHIRVIASEQPVYSKPSFKGDVVILANKSHSVKHNGLDIRIPERSLYNSTSIVAGNELTINSKIFIFPEVNLASAVSLGFKVPSELRSQSTKLVLKHGSTVYNGFPSNDSVWFAVKKFGSFLLHVDEIAPQVTYVKPPRTKKPKPLKYVAFKIADRLSGISTYSMTINNNWVPAEYDAKNDLLIWNFSDPPAKGHLVVEIRVTDKAGNSRSFSQTIKII